MILRYGWPSYAFWGGIAEDAHLYSWLGFGERSIDLSFSNRTSNLRVDSTNADIFNQAIFTSHEYKFPRINAVPTWSAILRPAHAADTDWTLVADLDSIPPLADTTWWPAEHMPRDRGLLLDIRASQRAYLRRDSSVVLAVAAAAPPKSGWTPPAVFPMQRDTASSSTPNARIASGVVAHLFYTHPPPTPSWSGRKQRRPTRPSSLGVQFLPRLGLAAWKSSRLFQVRLRRGPRVAPTASASASRRRCRSRHSGKLTAIPSRSRSLF